MKVIGIVGSPRRGGNTEALVRLALREIRKAGLQAELITLAGKKIAPCDSCRSCVKTGKCKFKDDFDPILAKMLKAEGIILATPVYYSAASPQLVSFISRCYQLDDKALKNKVGGAIVVARRAGQNFTFAQLLFFFLIHEMIVPGSTYWNIAFGRNPGEAVKDKEGVKTVRNFAKNMAWLIKKVNE